IKCPYNEQKCHGNFVVQKRSKNISNATDKWFIGCSRWWEKEKGKHFFQPLKKEVDPILLNKLFKNEPINLSSNTNSCSVTLSTKSHSTKC
ncbi:15189_t:CDS:2, partial [Gigaspora margarita]